MQATVAERHLGLAPVPAHAEPVAIGRGVTEPGIQALVDERVFRLEKHRFERNGSA